VLGEYILSLSMIFLLDFGISFIVSMKLYICPHMSEMSTFTYNLANSIIRKNAIIMSIIHNMLDLHDNNISSSKENRWPQPLFKY
jgi:hypothetical protein